MRYRMEVIEDELIIRNVDMDIRLGTAVPIYFYDQDRAALHYSSLHRPQQRWRRHRHHTHDMSQGRWKRRLRRLRLTRLIMAIPASEAGRKVVPTRTGSNFSSEKFWWTQWLSLRGHASNAAMAG